MKKRIRSSALGVTLSFSIFAAPQGKAQEEGTPIRIIAGEHTITAVLNDTGTARDFLQSLPRTLPMKRLFGREYYTVLSWPLPVDGLMQDTYELGDIAFWTKGNYFGILFTYERPVLSAPIVVVGRVNSEVGVFDGMEEALEMRFERME